MNHHVNLAINQMWRNWNWSLLRQYVEKAISTIIDITREICCCYQEFLILWLVYLRWGY